MRLGGRRHRQAQLGTLRLGGLIGLSRWDRDRPPFGRCPSRLYKGEPSLGSRSLASAGQEKGRERPCLELQVEFVAADFADQAAAAFVEANHGGARPNCFGFDHELTYLRINE